MQWVDDYRANQADRQRQLHRDRQTVARQFQTMKAPSN
jgi:hypothetical protein